MLENLGKPLTAEEYKIIHYLCIATVSNVHSYGKDFFPGGYRIEMNRVTKEALIDWEKHKLIKMIADINKLSDKDFSDPYEFLSAALSIENNVTFIMSNYMNISGNTRALASTKVDQLFGNYYAEIQQTPHSDKKLSLIILLCLKLEIGHFFEDGNQRAIVFVLLNKLLLENGFSPVILDDPFVFDGYLTISQLVSSVKTGMTYFQSLTSRPVHTLRPANESTALLSNNNLFKPTYERSSFTVLQIPEEQDQKKNKRNRCCTLM